MHTLGTPGCGLLISPSVWVVTVCYSFAGVIKNRQLILLVLDIRELADFASAFVGTKRSQKQMEGLVVQLPGCNNDGTATPLGILTTILPRIALGRFCLWVRPFFHSERFANSIPGTVNSIRERKMTFAQAIKTPKAGWKHANDEQMLASLSDTLARHCCLNAQKVFKWAKKHSNYRDLLRASQRLIDKAAEMELLVAVLNDLPLGQ